MRTSEPDGNRAVPRLWACNLISQELCLGYREVIILEPARIMKVTLKNGDARLVQGT